MHKCSVGRRVGWTFHGGVGLSISRLSQECSNARMFECSWSKVCESQIISLKVPSLGNLRKYTNQRIRRLLSRDFHKLRHFRKIKFVHSEKQNCPIKFVSNQQKGNYETSMYIFTIYIYNYGK